MHVCFGGLGIVQVLKTNKKVEMLLFVVITILLRLGVRQFWYVLHVFKSRDFCEWIMDHKTIITTYTLHNNCICMLATKHKSKIAKPFSGGQTHKITLLTDTQDIPKVQYMCTTKNPTRFASIILLTSDEPLRKNFPY